MLHIHNTLGRRKEAFHPRVPGQVGLYVCGITVYDHCHIGHARAMIVYDVLYRHLLSKGLDVTYVRNITDVDDKIIERAHANGETPEALADRFIGHMHEDAAALGVLAPTHEPRAVGHIDGVIRMIGTLVEGGHAYALEDGDVLYAVRSFEGYGKLSGRKLDELRSGARVAADERKRDPLDFALWKRAKSGEPSWPSPWGAGRPGWHIECSAMSTALLGEEFDIHGGGLDLEFPHHENEIAQSEAASGKGFARYWMHNGMVRVDGEKMSKSLGNFLTVRDALADHRGEELRFFVVASHYRSPLELTDEALGAARRALRGLYTALRGHPDREGAPDEAYVARFDAAMDDDLNTAGAVAVLHEIAGELNRLGARVAASPAAPDPAERGEPDAAGPGADGARVDALAATLRALGGRLGLLQENPEAVLRGELDPGAASAGTLSDEAIDALIEERRVARAAKDFARGDAIRDELATKGIVLEDGGGRTTWRRD